LPEYYYYQYSEYYNTPTEEDERPGLPAHVHNHGNGAQS
jgi:hypothetical protein